LRITGGSLRGRLLVDWREGGIRPVRDLVRGALFNMIADFVPGADCLDLFAGTGSLGLEALSRGAARSAFVDREQGACRIVRRNLDALGLLEFAEVLETACLDAVAHFARRGRRFDLVFLDPPYGQGLVPPTLAALADGEILTDDPVVAVVTKVDEGGDCEVGVLQRVHERRHGDGRIDLYRRMET